MQCTNIYTNGKQSGKHLWCEWPIALLIQGQAFMAINHDAFATGFEEHMRTALNPMRE